MLTKKLFKPVLIILVFNVFIFSDNTSNDTIVAVTAKTSSYGGKYAPENCVLMWIQKPDSTYIKTIYRAFETIKFCADFKSWVNTNGATSPEKVTDLLNGITGATRESHNETITAIWDCTDRNNKPVPNGTYEFWIGMNEDAYQPAKSTFGTIEIDGTAKKVQGTTSSNFPVLEAEYYTGNYHFPLAVKNIHALPTNSLSVFTRNNMLSIDLPNAEPYQISLFSLSGKVISIINGTGKKADIMTNSNLLKQHMYILKISQPEKIYTLRHILTR
jgi:hypothetical protein